MEKKLILRGLLAGAIAGVLAFIFARIFAEPVINQAISYQSGRDAMAAALDKAPGCLRRHRARTSHRVPSRPTSGSAPGMIAFGASMGALSPWPTPCAWAGWEASGPGPLALLLRGRVLGIYLVPFISTRRTRHRSGIQKPSGSAAATTC